MPAPHLIFERRSAMPASAAELFAWHLRPGAFERLLPPGDGTRIARRSGRIENDTMRVELSVPLLGPVRQTWRIRHEGFVPDTRFIDVMEQGPFPMWRHEHRAVPLDDSHSELVDHVDYALPLGALGRLAGRPIVEHRLTPMFAHRHAVTAGDLAAHARAGLPSLDVRLVDDGATAAGRQLAALLLTGGHRVAGDVDIAGYAPDISSPDVRISVLDDRFKLDGGADGAAIVERSADNVDDPRRVLTAIAALRA